MSSCIAGILASGLEVQYRVIALGEVNWKSWIPLGRIERFLTLLDEVIRSIQTS